MVAKSNANTFIFNFSLFIFNLKAYVCQDIINSYISCCVGGRGRVVAQASQ
jgi:hypothetical protein